MKRTQVVSLAVKKSCSPENNYFWNKNEIL